LFSFLFFLRDFPGGNDIRDQKFIFKFQVVAIQGSNERPSCSWSVFELRIAVDPCTRFQEYDAVSYRGQRASLQVGRVENCITTRGVLM